MATIVVTGASGFIGQALCAELYLTGIPFQAYSRRSVPQHREAKDENLGTYQRIDDYADIPIVAGATLVHLAETATISEVNANPSLHKEETLRITKSLIEKNFSRIVYVSSGAVYGYESDTPHTPSDRLEPRNAYGRIKIENENLVLDSGGAIARLGNVYGTGMSPLSVVMKIFSQLSTSGPLRLYDTRSIRDFIEVRDVARGLASMALGSAVGPFNLATGIGTSTGNLARLALTLASQSQRPILADDDTTPPTTIILDPTQTESCFCFRPSITLRDGLLEMMDKLSHER